MPAGAFFGKQFTGFCPVVTKPDAGHAHCLESDLGERPQCALYSAAQGSAVRFSASTLYSARIAFGSPLLTQITTVSISIVILQILPRTVSQNNHNSNFNEKLSYFQTLSPDRVALLLFIFLSDSSFHSRPFSNAIHPLHQMWKLFHILFSIATE
jgi:hypothetical protein